MAQEDDEAAVRLASALSIYWFWARPLEGCDWLERALARPARTATPARGEALIGLGRLLHRSGRAPVQRAEELLDEALGLALETGDDVRAARARYFLGELAVSRRDPAAAEPFLRAAVEAYEAMDMPLSAGWCRHALGWTAMSEGDRPRAQDHFERALELACRQEPAELLRVHAVAALAPLAALAGEAQRAESLAEEGVVASRSVPARGVLAMALTRAAETATLSGRRQQATNRLRELLSLLQDLGAPAWVADALEMVALMREAEGEAPSAARLLGASRAIEEAMGEQVPGIRVLSSEVDGCRRRLADVLGPVTFAEHEALGLKMSLGEAISYALEELHAPAPTP